MHAAGSACSAITAATLPDVLGTLLAPYGAQQPAAADQVRSFLDYLRNTSLEWIGVYAGSSQAIRAAGMALLLPGRAALVMLPHPGQLLVSLDDQRRATIQLFSSLAQFDLRYVQALAEPEAVPLRGQLELGGLEHLTRLRYFARDGAAHRPLQDAGGEWVTYGSATHRLFADTIEQTYIDSRDCPELCGLRPMDDVIASHRVAWTFNPATWEVLLRDGRPAGCVLQNLVAPRVTEIAYLGVTPSFRRKGVGAALVARALQHAHRNRVTRVMVVVDARNAEAMRLYARSDFMPTAERDVFLRVLSHSHRAS